MTRRRPPGGSPWAEDGAFFHGAHPGGGAGRGQSKNRGGPPSAWARRVPAGPAGKPDLGLKLTFGAQRIEAVILGEAAHPLGAEPDG